MQKYLKTGKKQTASFSLEQHKTSASFFVHKESRDFFPTDVFQLHGFTFVHSFLFSLFRCADDFVVQVRRSFLSFVSVVCRTESQRDVEQKDSQRVQHWRPSDLGRGGRAPGAKRPLGEARPPRMAELRDVADRERQRLFRFST